jgi:2-O-(6-phospho-alpha-D-mannosyl)-D-glycerate hydrolase
VKVPVEIVISLAAQSQVVGIEVKVDNRAENHRLRLLFPSSIATDVCFADVAYDVIERRIALPDSHDWKEPQLGTCPHHSFVGVADGRRDLAVFTAGTPEYEVIDDPQRTIAITLMRVFGRGAGEPHQYIDSQEQGLHSYRLVLYPFACSWESGNVLRETRLWGVSPLV